MKNIILILICSLGIIACKKEEKNIAQKQITIAEKIANAHGIQNWENISRISFTFNVDKDSTHYERSWVWSPKTSDVTLISKQDTIHYNRQKIDSISLKADQAFINDKYWLLAPFQLVWDSSTTISEPIKELAPISSVLLNKITLTYAKEGGYTPGDAYDFYYTNDFIIKEWVYREGNSKEASLVNTFENYEDFNGIKIAKEHIKKEGNWNLNFTNISILTN